MIDAEELRTGYTDDGHVSVRLTDDDGNAMRFYLTRLQAMSVAAELLCGTVATTIDTLRTNLKKRAK